MTVQWNIMQLKRNRKNSIYMEKSTAIEKEK